VNGHNGSWSIRGLKGIDSVTSALWPPHVYPGVMTVVVDIACPKCGETDPVRKEGLGTYRCIECDHTFSQTDVEPEG